MRKEQEERCVFRIIGLVILVAFSGCSTVAPYGVYVTPGMPMRVQLQYTTGSGQAGQTKATPPQAAPPHSFGRGQCFALPYNLPKPS